MTFREFSLMVKRLSGINDENMTILSMALDKPIPKLKKLWEENEPVSEGASLAIQRLIDTLPQFATLNGIFAKLDHNAICEERQGPNARAMVEIIAEQAEKPFESLWASSVASLAEAVPFASDSPDGRDYDQVIKGLGLVAFLAAGRKGHATVQ
jgi:hypothetical protein